MGNASKKLAAKCTLLNKDEQRYIANTFRSASKNSDKIREDDLIVSGTIDAVSLEKYWGPQIDPRLTQYLTNFLFGTGNNKQTTCEFNRFAELYVYNVRGTVDERMEVTYQSLGRNLADSSDLPYQLVREYCESIASTYIRVVKSSESTRFNKWVGKGFRTKASHVQALGEALASTLSDDENTHSNLTTTQLSRWLQSNHLLQLMTEVVFTNLYGVASQQHASHIRLDDHDQSTPTGAPSLVPNPEGIDAMPDYPAFIDLSHIVWLNSQLPQAHQHKWRFLFSSHIHGESFSTLAGRIQEQGASVLIIEDKNGYIFGGYASEAWVQGPGFHGNDNSFLFTLSPKMRVFTGTTYNNHYQYINQQTKTMPNGLMMGGQFEMPGIWIKANPFGEGTCGETCITYKNYKKLSKEGDFHIRSLEVWGVGEKPLSLKSSDERDVSVLDRNPEAKAILDMSGRTRHSDGIREPPPL